MSSRDDGFLSLLSSLNEDVCTSTYLPAKKEALGLLQTEFAAYLDDSIWLSLRQVTKILVKTSAVSLNHVTCVSCEIVVVAILLPELYFPTSLLTLISQCP